MTDLNKLEMEWRRYAIAFRDCGSLDAAALCERHADELEAALAGGGEAVAWMDHMGGVITAAMKTADPGRPYNTPLFTHHAGAVKVTDEMVDRYMARARPFCNCDVGECVHTERDVVRAALTAALNPGGSRE